MSAATSFRERPRASRILRNVGPNHEDEDIEGLPFNYHTISIPQKGMELNSEFNF